MSQPVMLPTVRCRGKYYQITYSRDLGYFKMTCNGNSFIESKGLSAKPFLQMLNEFSKEMVVEKILDWRLNK